MLQLAELLDSKHQKESCVFKHRERVGTRRVDTQRAAVEESFEWGYIARAADTIRVGEGRPAKDCIVASGVHHSWRYDTLEFPSSSHDER